MSDSKGRLTKTRNAEFDSDQRSFMPLGIKESTAAYFYDSTELSEIAPSGLRAVSTSSPGHDLCVLER